MNVFALVHACLFKYVFITYFIGISFSEYIMCGSCAGTCIKGKRFSGCAAWLIFFHKISRRDGLSIERFVYQLHATINQPVNHLNWRRKNAINCWHVVIFVVLICTHFYTNQSINSHANSRQSIKICRSNLMCSAMNLFKDVIPYM